MGDWAFLGEEARWRPVQTEEGRRKCKPPGVEGVWVEKVSDVEAEGGERNEHKKDEGKHDWGGELGEQRSMVEMKDDGKREVRKWNVLGTTALTRNKAQLFPTT